MARIAARIAGDAARHLPVALIHGAFLGVAALLVRAVALCLACGGPGAG